MADGIKFVQLDCHLDEKFEYIEAEFGLEGFAIIVKLFQRIYGGQGYYCEWSDRVALLFAKRIGAGANVVQEVVASALREHIFDEEIYRKYSVLTSHGIQKRFADVAKRRAVIFDKPEYVISSYEQISEDVCNLAENVCNSGQNVCNETTSKVSKAKQSKVSTSASPTAAPCFTREALVERYGEINVLAYEQRFDKWKAKKGGVKANRYETIAKMLVEDGVKKPNSSFEMDSVMNKIKQRYKEK